MAPDGPVRALPVAAGDARGGEARTLRDAEQRFLREARNRGFDTEADEVREARRRHK